MADWGVRREVPLSADHRSTFPSHPIYRETRHRTRSRPTLCRGIMKVRPVRPTFGMLQTVPDRDRGKISISKSGTDRPGEIPVGSRPGQSGGPTDYIL